MTQTALLQKIQAKQWVLTGLFKEKVAGNWDDHSEKTALKLMIAINYLQGYYLRNFVK